jgi:hypothetical protein
MAKPVSLLLCILSLYGVFHAAFLAPAGDVEHRVYHALALLVLAAGIALASGLIFREASLGLRADNARLSATLPVQAFCWASGVMFVLYLASWYLETHCIFYRDIRIWV